MLAKFCKEDQFWDSFLSTGKYGNTYYFPHPMEVLVFHVSETMGNFEFEVLGHVIQLWNERFHLPFALQFLIKWVTKETSECFVFPKQWEGHKCHFYLCSYQHWTGGHRLPFLVPATTASLKNLGPLLTIVLSYRKYGSLLSPSIHWVSCVRLPRPVFIFFAFCLYPPYRIFLTSTKPYKREDGTISTIGRRCSTGTNASLSL